MIRTTPVPPEMYGPCLAQWILDNIPEGMSWRRFSHENGIEPTRLISWRRGAVPSLDQIHKVARAFGVTMSTVLTAAGVLEEKEFRVEYVYDVDEAINRLPEGPRKAVLKEVSRSVPGVG